MCRIPFKSVLRRIAMFPRYLDNFVRSCFGKLHCIAVCNKLGCLAVQGASMNAANLFCLIFSAMPLMGVVPITSLMLGHASTAGEIWDSYKGFANNCPLDWGALFF